jgi:acetolactate synthase-1/2/3 large subunit
LRALAERLGAPVVQTVNARGVIHGHPLGVPASPSLQAVRDLIAGSDAVLAVGTELGPTDYDMYERGDMPEMAGLIRVDICPRQIARRNAALSLNGDAAATLEALNAALDGVGPLTANGAARAERARQAARALYAGCVH